MLKNFSYDRQWILPRGTRSINFYLAATASLVALSIVLTRYFSVLLFGNAMRLSICLLYTSPSPRDRTRSRMPSSA